MKMTEFLEKYQDKADAAIAVGCAVLLLASTGLLVNQFRLQKQLDTVKTAYTTLPTIHWYEEETTATATSATSAPGTAAALQAPEETAPALQITGKTYVLNTSSKKIHSPDCRYATSMKEENKKVVENADLDELLSEGYEVCSVCGGG